VELLKKFAAQHRVPVNRLAFSGDVLAPFTCKDCRRAWPYAASRRNHTNFGTEIEACTRSTTAVAEERTRLIDFQRQPTTHEWTLAPAENLLVCKKCGIYIAEVPTGQRAAYTYARKPCGTRFGFPWAGLVYHDDWAWYSQADITDWAPFVHP